MSLAALAEAWILCRKMDVSDITRKNWDYLYYDIDCQNVLVNFIDYLQIAFLFRRWIARKRLAWHAELWLKWGVYLCIYIYINIYTHHTYIYIDSVIRNSIYLYRAQISCGERLWSCCYLTDVSNCWDMKRALIKNVAIVKVRVGKNPIRFRGCWSIPWRENSNLEGEISNSDWTRTQRERGLGWCFASLIIHKRMQSKFREFWT